MTIWLLQDGEPLPTDDSPRLMRTGDLARRLVDAGFEVIWWTSRFNHNLKRFRVGETWRSVAPGYQLALLDGPAYSRNLSFGRMLHYRSIATQFSNLAASRTPPALILGSYPSPELCDAGARYAQAHGIPFVVDIRDPWPDIFPDYMVRGLRWMLAPVVWYYRRQMRRIARAATSVVAVSDAMLSWGLAYAGRPGVDTDKVIHIGFRANASVAAGVLAVPERFTETTPLICLFATTCGRSYDGELLVAAARLLEQFGERSVQFVVTGDGDMRATWLARAAGLSNVTFTGWIPHADLQRHFESAHVGLILMKGGITRFWLGNKIFEYLSADLAVVNNVGGEAGAIVAGEHVGVNVAAGDPAGLAHALRELASNPQRVLAQRQRAREAFNTRFSREAIQTTYLEHLQSLIRAPRRPKSGLHETAPNSGEPGAQHARECPT